MGAARPRNCGTMSKQWQYQVRIFLNEDLAHIARNDPSNSALRNLIEILEKYKSGIKCQYDAFADYVAEAERVGTDQYPLYEWTKATISDATKKNKYLKSFAVYVQGNEVYGHQIADALEADLKPLLADNLLTGLSKHDTNPANNPQTPRRYRKG